jgi:hypothetical protein
MAEPDTGGFNFVSLGPSFAISFFSLFGFYYLFQLRDTQYFNVLLWVGVPLIAFILLFFTNLSSQLISCNQIDAGKALMGGIPVIGTLLLGLAVSSISYCRIPVASVVAPLFLGTSMDVVNAKGNTNVNSIKNSNSNKCCSPTVSLESIELKHPEIAELNRGFYLMFSILFGFVIGNNISTVC